MSSKPNAGRVAVVTGASSGIGLETARQLAASGAKVALLARRKDRLSEAVDQIRSSGGTAIVAEVDVTSQASVDAAVKFVHEELGRADLVFNNAGIMLPGPISAGNFDEWQRQIDLNVSGAMRIIQAYVPQLEQAARAGAKADLINTSSIAGQYVYPYFAVYSATKAFISHLSRHLRVELGASDVRVSMIEPGVVETELVDHVTFAGAHDWLANAAKTVEFLKPGDIAEIVTFLASLPKHVNLQQVTVMPTRQGS
jgi:NADP-dependent 3-hydroxy acid dehydrogenase YdfG